MQYLRKFLGTFVSSSVLLAVLINPYAALAANVGAPQPQKPMVVQVPAPKPVVQVQKKIISPDFSVSKLTVEPAFDTTQTFVQVTVSNTGSEDANVAYDMRVAFVNFPKDNHDIKTFLYQNEYYTTGTNLAGDKAADWNLFLPHGSTQEFNFYILEPLTNISDVKFSINPSSGYVADTLKASALDEANINNNLTEAAFSREISVSPVQMVAGKKGIKKPQVVVTNKGNGPVSTEFYWTFFQANGLEQYQKVQLELKGNDSTTVQGEMPNYGGAVDQVRAQADWLGVYKSDPAKTVQILNVSGCSKLADKNSCVANPSCGWGSRDLNKAQGPHNPATMYFFDEFFLNVDHYLADLVSEGTPKTPTNFDTCITYDHAAKPVTLLPKDGQTVQTTEPVLSWQEYDVAYTKPAVDESQADIDAESVVNLGALRDNTKQSIAFFRWKILDADTKAVVWERNFSEPKEDPINNCNLVINSLDQNNKAYLKDNYWDCPFVKVPAGILEPGKSYLWMVQAGNTASMYGNSVHSDYTKAQKFTVSENAQAPMLVPKQKIVPDTGVGLAPLELTQTKQGKPAVKVVVKATGLKPLSTSVGVTFQKANGESSQLSYLTQVPANGNTEIVAELPAGVVDAVRAAVDEGNIYNVIKNSVKKQTLSISTCGKVAQKNSCLATVGCGWSDGKGGAADPGVKADNNLFLNINFELNKIVPPGNGGVMGNQLGQVQPDGSCVTYKRLEVPTLSSPINGVVVSTTEPVLAWYPSANMPQFFGIAYKAPSVDADAHALDNAAMTYSINLQSQSFGFFAWKVVDDSNGKVVWERKVSDVNEAPVNHCSVQTYGLDKDGKIYMQSNYWYCPFAKVPAGILKDGQTYRWSVQAYDVPALGGNSAPTAFSEGIFTVKDSKNLPPQKLLGDSALSLEPLVFALNKKGQTTVVIKINGQGINNIVTDLTVTFTKAKGATEESTLPVTVTPNKTNRVEINLPKGQVDAVTVVVDKNGDYDVIKNGTKAQSIGVSVCGHIKDRNSCVATANCAWSDGSDKNTDPGSAKANLIDMFNFGFEGFNQNPGNNGGVQLNKNLNQGSCVSYDTPSKPFLFSPVNSEDVSTLEPVLSWYATKKEADDVAALKKGGKLPGGAAVALYEAPLPDADALDLDALAVDYSKSHLQGKPIDIYRFKVSDDLTGAVVWQRDFSDPLEAPVHICSLQIGGATYWVCPFVKMPAGILKAGQSYTWTVEKGDLVTAAKNAHSSGYAAEEKFKTLGLAKIINHKNDPIEKVETGKNPEDDGQVPASKKPMGIDNPKKNPTDGTPNPPDLHRGTEQDNLQLNQRMILVPETEAQKALRNSFMNYSKNLGGANTGKSNTNVLTPATLFVLQTQQSATTMSNTQVQNMSGATGGSTTDNATGGSSGGTSSGSSTSGGNSDSSSGTSSSGSSTSGGEGTSGGSGTSGG